MSKKKLICIIAACVAVVAIACVSVIIFFGGEKEIPLDSEHGIADQSNLYGMCYLLEGRAPSSRKPAEEVEIMKNMGVKSVRHWMHFSHFMKSPTELKDNSTETEAMHDMLRRCTEAGIMNIGMNHHNFCTTKYKDATAKPYARDISEGSEYVQWLNDYYTSWKTLVAEFPEVEYWEIDNEVNNPDFMTDGTTPRGSSVYTVKQMAQIATDMFYYASRAIHEVNPNAKTVMGSLTEPTGLGRGNSEAFLNMLYDNIQSGKYGYFYGIEDQANASTDADDYFQIACWHPYMSNFHKENFISTNRVYYDIILEREGKHKKVFFTEMGWNDSGIGGESVYIDFMEQMFDACKQLPFVETVNVFRLYDQGTLGNWDGNSFLYYGFFHDPNPANKYTPYSSGGINIDENGYCIPGAPKNKAYAFQRIAGGSGDLEVLMKAIQND